MQVICQYLSEDEMTCDCEMNFEIRTFELQNDKLVDGGVLWKKAGDYNYIENYPKLASACFV